MNVISAIDALHLNARNDGFRVGQVLEGMVVEVSEDGIATVNLSGKTITVASGSEMLRLGETVRLKITQIEKGEVLATRVDLKETSLLNKLGVPVTQENVGYISELLEHQHAIDKNLLSRLSKNAQEVKMLHDLLQNGAQVDDIETPIRGIVIRLLQEEGAAAGTATWTSPKMSETASSARYGSAQLLADSSLPSGDTSNFAANRIPISENQNAVQSVPSQDADLPAGEDAIQADLLKDSLQGEARVILGETKLSGSQAPENSIWSPDRLSNSSNAVANFDHIFLESSSVQEEGVLTGENTPTGIPADRKGESDANAKTLALNPKQEAALKLLSSVSDKSDFLDALKYLLSHFDSHDNVTMALQRKTLNLKNLAQIQFDVSDIADEFVRASNQSSDSAEILSIVKDLEHGKDLESIIQSRFPRLKMISEAVTEQVQPNNPGIYYISLPVRLMGEEKRADMYFKRSPKKPDEFSILVVLNTQNLGEVRCLIYKMDREYMLGLALEDDEITDLVREKISHFRSNVRDIQIVIRSREEMEDSFFEKKESSSYLDLRV